MSADVPATPPADPPAVGTNGTSAHDHERDMLMGSVLLAAVVGIVVIAVVAMVHPVQEWQIPNTAIGYLKDLALVVVGGYFGAKYQAAKSG